MRNRTIGITAVLAIAVVHLLARVAVALPDIPIPADFYDGAARKTQVDALTTAVRTVTVTEITQTVTLRGDVTIQVVDAAGTAATGNHLVRVWSSATSMGAPSATDNGGLVFASTKGVSAQQVVQHADHWVISNASGLIEARLTVTSAGDRYIMASVGGKIVASDKLEIAVIE